MAGSVVVPDLEMTFTLTSPLSQIFSRSSRSSAETLFPAEKWRAVTVIAEDSGLADALSTTLFLSTQEEGQALLDRFGAAAMWVQKDGTQIFSPGYEAYMK